MQRLLNKLVKRHTKDLLQEKALGAKGNKQESYSIHRHPPVDMAALASLYTSTGSKATPIYNSQKVDRQSAMGLHVRPGGCLCMCLSPFSTSPTNKQLFKG